MLTSDIDALVNSLVPRLQTSESQSTAIEVAPNGDTLVVFHGRDLVDNDGIFVRRLAAQEERSIDFRANATVAGNQSQPAIAVFPNGDYVIAWSGRGPGDHSGIFARWYNQNDIPLTPEILINQITGGTQQEPDVAVTQNGVAVFVWSGSAGSEEPSGVFRRFFDANGNPLSNQHRVNVTTTGTQDYPSVTTNADGRGIVTWSSHDLQANQWQVYHQTFFVPPLSQSGEFPFQPIPEEALISAQPSSNHQRSRVATDALGNYVVTWASLENGTSQWNIFSRSFDASGTPRSADILVNQHRSSINRDPHIAMAEDGRYIISWTVGNEDGSGWEVYAQSYAPGGLVAEAQYLVHSTSGLNSGHQQYSAVAIGQGPAQIAWSGTGQVDRRGVWIRRTPTAQSPRIQSIPPQTIDELSTLVVQITPILGYPEQTVRFDLEPFSHPLGMVIDPSTGRLTWTPSESDGPGEFTAIVEVSDRENPTLRDRQRIRISVREVNRSPEITLPAEVTIDEGEVLRIAAAGTDFDIPANSLVYSIVDSPTPNLTLNPSTGAIYWETTEEDGGLSGLLTIRVTDNGVPPRSAIATTIINVAEIDFPPIIAPINAVAIPEERAWQLRVEASDPDSADPENLVYSLDSGLAEQGISIDNAGIIRWTPSESNGPGEFTGSVLVTDRTGLQSSAPLQITVFEVNKPPVLSPIDAVTTNVDTLIEVDTNAVDTDLPRNQLHFTLDPSSLQRGITIDSLTGLISWTPVTPGIFPVTVSVHDDGIPSLSDQRTFSIIVDQVIAPPRFDPVAPKAVDEQSLLSFPLTVTSPNPDRTYQFTLGLNQPDGLSIDPITGLVQWTPTESQGPSLNTVRFEVFDVELPNLRSTIDVPIEVFEVNQPPRITGPIERIVDEGELLEIELRAADEDIPSNHLTFRLAPNQNVPTGLTIHPTTGLLRWQTRENDGPGIWNLRVEVLDDGVPSLKDQTDVRIFIREVNQPPSIVHPPNTTIPEMVLWSFPIFVSDSDIPTDVLSLSLDPESIARGMSLDNANRLQWTPTEDDGPGIYPVTIEVSDNGTPPLKADTTFYVTVSEVNRPPIIDLISDFSIRAGEPVTFNASAMDPDRPDNRLRFSLAGEVPAGAVIDPVSGVFNWTSSAQTYDGALYRMTVKVTDDGDPTLFDDTDVTIEVLPNTIVLREESRFVTAYEQRVQLQEEVTTLQFQFDWLQFDTNDRSSMNDAFEVALLDDRGMPLAGIVSPGRDAFLNLSEGEPALLGSGTALFWDESRGIVSVDVRHLPAGSSVRLVQRLVNNDQDNLSQVTILPGVRQISEPQPRFVSTTTPPPFAPIPRNSQTLSNTDWKHLKEVTGQTTFDYNHTAFDVDTNTVAAGIQVTNQSTITLRSPILLAVTQVDLPGVAVVGYQGVIPRQSNQLEPTVSPELRGAVYYDLTEFLIEDALRPGESIDSLLQFLNPTASRFDYQLHLLSHVNQPPSFRSSPADSVRYGNTYLDDAIAVDPDGDSLRYSLVSGPENLVVNEESGEIRWTPSRNDIGNHSVTIVATDPYGLSDTKTFSIRVFDSLLLNHPPIFVTDPVIDAYVGQTYDYRSLARDPDFDLLVYDLLDAPLGMQISDEFTGPHRFETPLMWIPRSSDVGKSFPVTLRATDPYGASTLQSYTIHVHGNPANLPPQIITQPRTQFTIPQLSLPDPYGNVTPNGVKHLLGLDQQITVPLSITLPDDVVLSTADIVLVVDESGSMEEQSWVATFIASMEDSLRERGVGNNRYAIVGYGSFLGLPRFVTDQNDYDILVFSEDGSIIDHQTVRAGIPTQQIAFPSDGQYTVAVTRYTPSSAEPTEASVPPLDPLSFQFRATSSNPSPLDRNGWGYHSGSLEEGLVEIPFQSGAGELLLIDGIQGDSISAELVDPHHRSVLRLNSLLEDSAPIVLRESGEYRLVLRGITGSPFRLALHQPLKDAIPISTSTPVEGVLGHPDQWQFFSVDTLDSTDWIIDRLSPFSNHEFGPPASGYFDLHFFGPSGLIASSILESNSFGALPQSAPHDITDIHVDQGGTYSIGVRRSQLSGNSGAPIPFKFQIHDIEAVEVTEDLGTPIAGSLSSPTGAQVHRLHLEEAMSLEFDILSVTNSNARWRWIDPDGYTIIEGTLENGTHFNNLPVRVTGTYSLVIQGNYDNAVDIDYLWRMRGTSEPPETPIGPRFAPNELLLAELDAGQEKSYFVEFTAGDLVYPSLVTPSEASVWWQLRSPTGGVLHSTFRTTTIDPGFDAGQMAPLPRAMLRAPQTGIYELLLLSPNTEAHVAFHVQTETNPLVVDSWQTGQLTPSGSVAVFTLDAAQGETLVLKSTQDNQLFAGADDAVRHASSLRANGDLEDGYWGISHALDYLPLRPNASQHIILLTDEDRDDVQLSLTREVIAAKFDGSNPKLHVISNSRLFSADPIEAGHSEAGHALGVVSYGDSSEAPYRFFYATPEGLPRETIANELVVEDSHGTTFGDYIELSLSTQGTVWDIQRLRHSGPSENDERQSLTRAFVSTLTEVIAREAVVGLSFTPADAPVTIDAPQIEDRIITFPVHFTGDGSAWNILFEFTDVNSPEILYGTIPAALSSSYQYDFDAIDPEFDPISYSLAPVEYPGVEFNTDRQRLYFAPQNPGVYTFELTAMDRWGGTDQQRWDIHVSEPTTSNHPPLFSTIAIPQVEVGRSIETAFNAWDPDGDAITYRLVPSGQRENTALPPTGSTIVPTSGLFKWTPQRHQIGFHEITIYATDGRGGTAIYPWGIEVVPPRTHHNHPPEFLNTVPTLAIAGTTFRHTISTQDIDLDPIEYSLAWGPESMQVHPDLGTLVWNPTTTDLGPQTVIVRITDGQGGIQLQEVSLMVAEGNLPPVFVNTPPSFASLNQRWLHTPKIKDPNGDIPQIRLTRPWIEQGLSIDPDTGELSWLPESIGLHTFDIEAIDHRGGIARQSFSVEVRETSPPVVASPSSSIFVLGQSSSLDFLSYDFDHDDQHGLSLPAWATELGIHFSSGQRSTNQAISLTESTHRIDWNPARTGTYQIPITIEDTQGETSTVEWTVEVVPPSAASIPPQFTTQPKGPVYPDAPWFYRPLATDPDGNRVTITLESPITSDLFWNAEAGTLSWVSPSLGSSLEVVLKATDASGVSTLQSFVLSPESRPSTQPPQWISIPNTHASVGALWTYRLAAKDPSGTPVTITLAHETLALGVRFEPSTNTLTWTPSEQGNYRIELTARNAFGDISLHAFDLSVQPRTNRVPQIRSIPTGPATLGIPWTHQVQAFDSDGDALHYSIAHSGLPSDIQIDQLTGHIIFLPTAFGTYETTIIVRDDHGSETSQSFSLQVVEPTTPGNSNPPVFTSAPAGPAYLHQPWSYQVRTSSSASGNVTLSLDPASLARGATLSSEGVLRWTPDQTGNFDFLVTARGSSGRERTQTFRLNVQNRNRPPLIQSIPTIVPVMGEAWTYRLIVDDPDGERPILSLNPTAIAAGLTLDNDSTIRWTPTRNQQSVQVEITATDSYGATAVQKFHLSPIEPQSNPGDRIVFRGIPTLEITTGTLFEYSIDAFNPGALANQADEISYTLIGNPAGMTIDQQKGTIRWFPESIGEFPITLIAQDSFGNSRSQSSLLKVIPNRQANRAPRFESQPLFPAVRDLPYRYPLEVLDPDGDTIDLYLDPQSLQLGFEINEDRSLTWIPTESGIHRIAITAVDIWGSSTLQQFDLIVLDNAPPQIHSLPDTVVLSVGIPSEYQLVAFDPNSEQSLEYSVDPLPEGAMIDPLTGRFQWIPQTVGLQQLRFTVTDIGGLSTTQYWTYSVVDPSINHPPEIVGSPRTKLALGHRFNYQITAIDREHEPLTYSLVSGPSGIMIDAAGQFSWTPDESQVTLSHSHEVVVSVTDARGLSDHATWYFRVGSTLDNEPPEINGAPLTTAVVGRAYHTMFSAIDVDGDSTDWEIVPNRGNARIDDHGVFVWTPGNEDLGRTQWILTARDPWGAQDDFEFSIDVRGGNSPARISGMPQNLHRRGTAYRYQFTGTDPDADSVRFDFAPGTQNHGAMIDHSSGVFTWVPLDDGTFEFTVVAIDPFNEGSGLRFSVTVDAWGPNEPPEFVDIQPGIAEGGTDYLQRFSAVDPEGLLVIYEVVDGPEGMTIDSEGQVRWSVPESLIGTEVLVTLRAHDPAGFYGHYYARIPVKAPNRPPVIVSNPVTQQTWGGIYQYLILTEDPDHDHVSIDLGSLPNGAMLDVETNRVYWDTRIVNLGSHSFAIEASDGRVPAPITQQWNVEIVADTTRPTVQIVHGDGPFLRGDSIVVTVLADDDTQIIDRVLLVDGVGVSLDANGHAVLQLNRAGLISLEGIATDPSGNTGSYQTSIRVRDPNNSAPQISIRSPESGQRITTPVEILGSITDTENQLVRIEVSLNSPSQSIEPVVLLEQLSNQDGFVENRIHESLAIIDPTLLPNGFYTLWVVAEDAGGNVTHEKIDIEVAGLLKLGSYSTTFDDLTIPIAGIPLSIRRSYNSLHANAFGDFGYGWNLDTNQVQLRMESEFVGGAGQGRYSAFKDGTGIHVLLPEGFSILFRFQPEQDASNRSGAPTFLPRFTPVGGSVYQLIAPQKTLRRIQDEYYTIDGIPYNPADPEIGNFLLFVTPDGRQYRINPSTFKTESITDRNGNQVVFTETAIASNRGTAIQIQHDHRNRISAIIDPRGNKITYAYDSLDRLISITDRLQNTLPAEQQKPLRLTYHSSDPYRLHQTIAGDGTVIASSEIDANGRMDAMRGPSEIVVHSNFDITSRTQSISMGAEIDVEQFFDASGNLSRIADSPNAATELTYSESGKPTSITRIIYDETSGEVAERFSYALELDQAGRVLGRTSPDGNRTRYILDAETGLLQAEIDALGNRTSYGYDERGNLTSITKPNQQETRYVFDDQGNIIRASIVDLSPGSQGACDEDPFAFNRCFAETIAFEAMFDDRGNQTEKTNHLGVTTTNLYDANHQLIQTQTRERSSDTNLIVQSTTQYDPNDQPISSASVIVDPSGGDSSPRQTDREFNLLGQITRESTLSGIVTSSRFNTSGLPSSIMSVSPDGTTNISYQIHDSMGRVSIQTDPVPIDHQPVTGKRYKYDKVGQIIQTEALIGLTIDVRSNGEHQDVILIDEGNILPGAVASADAINHPGLIATNDGRSTQRVRDYLGRTIQTTTSVRGIDGTPDVRIQKTAYDSFGRVLTATDPYIDQTNAPITGVRYVYAPTGETLRVDRVSNLSISVRERPDGTWESVVESPGMFIDNDVNQFDSAGRTTSLQQPDGTRIDFVYDSMGRTVLRQETPVGNVETETRIVLKVHESDAEDPFLSVVTSDPLPPGQDTYSHIQATRTISDSQGRVVRTEYLSQISLAFETLPGGRGKATVTEPGEIIDFSTTTYDSLGRIVSQREFSGAVTEYMYDESGNLKTITGPEYFDAGLNETVRSRSEFNYSGSLRISSTSGIRVFLNGTVDLSAAATTRFVYDTSGRLVRTIDANGQSTSTEYDLQGRPLLERNAAGHETRYLYDSSGNLKSVLLPLTEDANIGLYHPRTDFGYDDWGNRVSTITGIVHYPDGTIDRAWARETRELYDATGRLVSTQRPEGLLEQRTYTDQGLIDRIIRSDGSIESYQWSRDTLNPGLLRTEYYASLASYETGVPDDFTDASTDTRGNVTTHFGIGSILRMVNDRGQIATIQSPSGTLVYQYDRQGRIITVTSMETENSPSVRTEIQTTYDSAGRIATVSQTIERGVRLLNPITYRYSHDGFGRPQRVIHPDGTIEVYRYDLLGRRTSVEYFAGDLTPETLADNARLARFQSSFDSSGHRAYLHETILDGVTQAVVMQREVFLDHDAAGRLVRYRVVSALEEQTTYYEYDPAHNRTAEKTDVGSDGVFEAETQWVYDFADRLLNETKVIQGVPTTVRSFSYGVGSTSPSTITTQRQGDASNFSTASYEYDLRGYLTAIDTIHSDSAGTRARTEWSRTPVGTAFQKREMQWENQTLVTDRSIDILIDDQSLTGYSQWFETRDSGTDETLLNVIAGHRVLAEIESSGHRDLWIDPVGSVRMVRDLASGDHESLEYDPYGRALTASSSLHGYGGEVYDQSTGQIELRQRTYDPSLGRFLQPDRFSGLSQVPTSLHRYLYASNAPFTYRDPSGNVFVLIDGTWNHDSAAHLEEGEAFTNIVALRDAYLFRNPNLQPVYERGVGNPVDNGRAMGFGGGAFGFGLNKIIESAVDRSLNTVLDGEPIFIAGFSRGAIATLQYAHEIQKLAPAARIRLMAIYDPVASVGFPGNGINIGYNVSLATNVSRAVTLVSWQEDRGFFPGTNVHSKRASQYATFGVHSDVGGGYSTEPTAMIKDSLSMFIREFINDGLAMRKVGITCPLCTAADAHHPHPTSTYLKHGFRVPSGLRRPMIEHPMPGELGLAFFAEDISLKRIGAGIDEARAEMVQWIPNEIHRIYRNNVFLSTAVGIPFSTLYVTWNMTQLYASNLHYWVNRT